MRANPDMFRLARDVRDLTQTNLAKKSGVGQATISKIESGAKEPTPDVIGKLSEALAFPESFFAQDEQYLAAGISAIYFRKRASTLKRHTRRILAEANLHRIIALHLLRDVNVDTPFDFSFFDIDESGISPEAVATMVRANWNLPDGPIRDLIGAAEKAGCVVFKFPFGTNDIDALSHWPQNCPPLIFINAQASPDRIRYSMAHELGHLCMHDSATETIEEEADRFASELLMPRDSIRPHFMGGVTLRNVAALKEHWGVSMAALLVRAKTLRCVTASRYRSMFIDMSERGWRRREPNPIQPETPRLMGRIIESYFDAGFTAAEMAAQSRVFEDDLRSRFLAATGLRLG